MIDTTGYDKKSVEWVTRQLEEAMRIPLVRFDLDEARKELDFQLTMQRLDAIRDEPW
jgi:hypothetical protein